MTVAMAKLLFSEFAAHEAEIPLVSWLTVGWREVNDEMAPLARTFLNVACAE